MKLERIISEFSIDGEKLEREININEIPLQVLKSIFKVKDNDPLMYDPYPVNEAELILLNAYLPSPIDFNFEKFIYQIDCFEI